jgi:hypothetical protein
MAADTSGATLGSCNGKTILPNPKVPGTCYVCVIPPYDTQITSGTSSGLTTGDPRSSAVADAFSDCVVAVATGVTCIAEVSTAELTPAVVIIPGKSGTARLGSWLNVSPTACDLLTVKAFKLNKAWSDPKQLCARAAGFGDSPSITHLVYATDYLTPPGNTGGVNRVDGYAVICDPTIKIVIPNTL